MRQDEAAVAEASRGWKRYLAAATVTLVAGLLNYAGAVDDSPGLQLVAIAVFVSGIWRISRAPSSS